MSEQPIFRFAPSPNGELHLGHALSALTAFEQARSIGGRFLLRIEDIDTGRARSVFEQQIYDDLEWLGLCWETPVRRQSAHFADYKAALDKLHEQGLLYPCFATRRQIREAAAGGEKNGQCDPDGTPLYPGLHRDLDEQAVRSLKMAGKPFALRLDMQRALALARQKGARVLGYSAFDPGREDKFIAVDPAEWGDVVVARKDVPTSYHLAVCVDDALQGVSHVTRGLDLLAATSVHVLLQHLLGLPIPKYHHHRLILDDMGQKLSKSRGAKSLKSLRKDGLTLSDIRKLAGFS